MAVATIHNWRPFDGRTQDFMASAGTAKKIHERLGGRTRLWAYAIGSRAGSFGYSMVHEDARVYGDFVERLAADEEWTAVLQAVGASPSAELVDAQMWSEVPGVGSQRQDESATVASMHTWRPRPGRAADFLTTVSRALTIHTRLGGRVGVWATQFGGHGRTFNYLVGHKDGSAYGAFTDKLQDDTEFQELWQTALSDPTADLIETALIRTVPGM